MQTFCRAMVFGNAKRPARLVTEKRDSLPSRSMSEQTHVLLSHSLESVKIESKTLELNFTMSVGVYQVDESHQPYGISASLQLMLGNIEQQATCWVDEKLIKASPHLEYRYQLHGKDRPEEIMLSQQALCELFFHQFNYSFNYKPTTPPSPRFNFTQSQN